MEEISKEVNAFKGQFSADPEFSSNQASVYFMKAEALFELNRYEEALQVYKDVLELNPKSIDIVSIQRISEVLVKLDQVYEAKTFLTDAIKNQLVPSYKLDFLYCYVNLFEETANEMAQFQRDIYAIAEGLAIDLPENIGLRQLIVYLQKEKNAASRRFGELIIRISEMTVAEKQSSLKDFIANEQVGYFKKMAEDYLGNIDV